MKKTNSTIVNPALLQPSPELLEIQEIMPIAKDDRARLENDIRNNGVRDAIKVYQNEDGEFLILGGMNRWEIATAECLEQIPIDIYSGSIEEYRQLVRDDNLNRRHLNSAQKRGLIEFELLSSPEKSNRQIAEETKTHHVTVAKVRAKQEKKGEIKKQEKTVGKDGKERTTARKEPAPKAAKPKKTIKCPHCGEEIEI